MSITTTAAAATITTTTTTTISVLCCTLHFHYNEVFIWNCFWYAYTIRMNEWSWICVCAKYLYIQVTL